MPLLTEFLKTHPEVRIELDMSDRLRALATEGFDLAIRHTAQAPDTHVAWTLCRTESVLVATRAYLRKKGEPQVPQDLQAHNCLHYPRSQELPVWTFEPRQNAAKAKPAPDLISVAVNGSLAANNSEALREAARALRSCQTSVRKLRSGKASWCKCWRPTNRWVHLPSSCLPFDPTPPTCPEP